MLVDVVARRDMIADMMAKLNSNADDVIRLQTGIYQIGHFSFGNLIKHKNEYPTFNDVSLNSYGVCDDYHQILERYKELKTKGRRFVIAVTPVLRKNQSPEGGWRWHKWGPYIGTKTPTCEYLCDEPKIEKVYCYHIYEV